MDWVASLPLGVKIISAGIGKSPYCLGRYSSRISTWLISTNIGGAEWPLFLQVKCGILGFPLDLCWFEPGQSHSLFCCVWLKWSSYCQRVFCLARLPLFWSLCWRQQAFVAAILLFSLSSLSSSLVCLCLLSFLGSWLLQLKVWDIWHRKKTKGTHHCVLPLVMRSLSILPSPLHFAESYVYFIHGVQAFRL